MDLTGYTVSGQKERAEELALHNRRLIMIRWVFTFALTGVAVFAAVIAQLPSRIGLHYVSIGLCLLFFNSLFWLLARYATKSYILQALLVVQLLLDISVASYLVYDLGGIQARTTILYALPIAAAGLLFSTRIVYFTALMSSVGYIIAVLLEEYHSGDTLTSSQLPALVFYPVAFLTLSVVITFLMNRTLARTREQAYDAFLALLTHQLKHPASTAAAILDVLRSDAPKLDKDTRHYIDMLNTENESLIELINNLLATATDIRPEHFSELDLVKLVESASHRVANSHERSDDLKLKLPGNPLTITGSHEKLNTMLINVLDNAFEYSEKGSPVTVNLHHQGKHIIITIDDKGGGISQAQKKQLFKKYALHRETGHGVRGAGLGLFVAQKVVRAHNGTLKITSNEGKGTQITITLTKEG